LYVILNLCGEPCSSRIDKLRRRWPSGTVLDSDSARCTNRRVLATPIRPYSVLAGVLPAPHAFDEDYSNVGNRLVFSPGRPSSRLGCDPGTRAEPFQSTVRQRDAKAARMEPSLFRSLRRDREDRSPSMESIQGVMIRAEIFRQTLPANCSTEHPAQRHTVNDAALDGKAHDAMCKWSIEAPQTILHVADKRRPARTSRIRFRPVMNHPDTPNNTLVDVDAESLRDLLSDAGTTPAGITTFHCNDGFDEVFPRSLRAKADAHAGVKTTCGIFVSSAHCESAAV